MKRILVFILAVMIVLPLFVACNTGDNGGVTEPAGETTNDPTVSDGTGEPEETEVLKPVLPDEDFGGYEIKVLSCSAHWYSYDIVGDQHDDPYIVDAINEAVANRNQNITDEYNVTFKNIGANNVLSESRNAIANNRTDYDILLPAITAAGQLAQQGYLVPVQEMQYINTEKAYYDQRCLEELEIAGLNFFFFSDITTVNLDAIWTYYFNHALIEYYSLENPYDLLSDYKWTLDKMIEMCETATNDADGTPTKEDNWGMVGHSYIITSAYVGSGERVATTMSDGSIELTMNTDNALAVLNKLITLRPYWCRYALGISGFTEYGDNAPYGFNPGDNYPELVSVFTSGNALFMGEVLSALRDPLSNYDMKVGILPAPMLSDSQREYYSAVNGIAPAMCVPITNTDIDRTSIIIEAWAYESRQILLPVYYDSCMQSRYAKDAVTPEVLDMLLASRSYDLGIYYSWGNLDSRYAAMIYNGQNEFSSMYGSWGPVAQTNLDIFISYFE